MLLLDVSRLLRNLRLMQQACSEAGVALRPHAKGHKCAWIAARQIAGGAVGVAVATPREALSLLRHGIDDVLITSGLGVGRAAQAAAAARLGRVAVVAGDVAAVRILGDAARELPGPLRVLVDVDVGQRRGGVIGPDAAAAVAEAIAGTPRLEYAGIQGYDGHLQGIADARRRRDEHAAAMERLEAVAARLRRDGLPTGWVTTAGTGTAPLALATPGVVTEIQPGSYALMDSSYSEIADMPFEQAVTVITAVIAVIGPTEVVVDAGTRAVSTDLGPPMVLDFDARWEAAGDEHGRVIGDVDRLAVGDLIALVPSHSDTTVPLHSAFVVAGARHDAPESGLPILRD